MLTLRFIGFFTDFKRFTREVREGDARFMETKRKKDKRAEDLRLV